MAKKHLGVLVGMKVADDVSRLAGLRDLSVSELGARLFEREVEEAKKSGELPKH